MIIFNMRNCFFAEENNLLAGAGEHTLKDGNSSRGAALVEERVEPGRDGLGPKLAVEA